MKEDFQTLEAELATLTKKQAETDNIRQGQHADFKAAKAVRAGG